MKKTIKDNIKIVVTVIIIAIIVGSITGVVAYNYSAKDISYTPKDNNWNVDNVDNALGDLYNTLNAKIENNYKLLSVNGGSTIPVEPDKKYIVFVSTSSVLNQNYKPSISGCTIEKTLGQIGNTHSSTEGLAAYGNGWIVTTTSNTITIGGNPYGAIWNHVCYYKLD